MLGRAACAYIFFKRFFSNGNIQYAPHSFLVYIGTKLASTSRLSLQAKHQAALLVLVLACTQGMLRSGRQAVALRSRQKYGFTLTLQHLNSSQRLRYALYEEFISKTNWTKCAYTSYRMLPCHILPPPPLPHSDLLYKYSLVQATTNGTATLPPTARLKSYYTPAAGTEKDRRENE